MVIQHFFSICSQCAIIWTFEQSKINRSLTPPYVPFGIAVQSKIKYVLPLDSNRKGTVANSETGDATVPFLSFF